MMSFRRWDSLKARARFMDWMCAMDKSAVIIAPDQFSIDAYGRPERLIRVLLPDGPWRQYWDGLLKDTPDWNKHDVFSLIQTHLDEAIYTLKVIPRTIVVAEDGFHESNP